MLTLTTAHATCTLNPYGAQVMSFIPHGQPDVLWQTTPEYLAAAEAAGKPLRGGIPLCWPWFRGHPTHPTAPSHGWARLHRWDILEHHTTPERAMARLGFIPDATHPAFPYKARAELLVHLGQDLEISLTTWNEDTVPFAITEALHSYIRVGHTQHLTVTGLEGAPCRYIPTGEEEPPLHGPLTLGKATEHVWHDLKGPVRVHDAILNRTIRIDQDHGHDVVLWNPGLEGAKTLDMPPESYQTMLCVEAANILTPLTFLPGQSHTLSTRLRVEN